MFLSAKVLTLGTDFGELAFRCRLGLAAVDRTMFRNPGRSLGQARQRVADYRQQ